MEAQKKVNAGRLARAAMEGNWKVAKEILDAYPELKTERIQRQGMTALLLAAKCGKSEFVEELVSILSGDDLEMMFDENWNNAFHHAAAASDVRAARAILQKSPSLTEDVNMEKFNPLFHAARWGHPSKSKKMLELLYEKTNPSVYKEGDTAPSLVVAIAASGCHGIVLSIVKRYPKLAFAKDADNWSILHMLATQPSAFSSRRKKSLLCRLMNLQATKQQRRQQKRHKDARELVHFVCQKLQIYDKNVMAYFLPNGFHAILNLATVHGACELVKICLQYFPELIWYTSSGDQRMLLHVAVEHRREEIYNLVMRLVGENAGSYARTKVGDNNILHLAAKLAPTPQLHSGPGPAFQMQRELQWFKAVESIVYTEQRHEKNKPAEGFTPEEFFYENHRNLITDAKEWMKDISNSCMVVAALVATVAFASMITLPGGNNNDTGRPILSKQKVFVVFSVANAASMISSAIALLMFLSLQTSRYTNEDFLESLPKTLVRGLLALFVAVATMMLAFGTAIGLALQTRVKWAYILITVVACIPVTIFTWLHVPLLAQTVKISSGPVISGQRRSLSGQCLEKVCDYLVPHDDLV